jgi:hypothetical protein
MTTDSPSPATSRPKRSNRRLRALLVVNFLALGLYIFARLDPSTVHALGPLPEVFHRLFNQIFVPTDPRLSPVVRNFTYDVKALGGEPSVAVPNLELLRRFGRSEFLGASFHTQMFDDQALARLAELHGDKIYRLALQSTGVTDAGLQHLRKMIALQHLVIDNSVRPGPRGNSGSLPTITDDGLIRLRKLTQLQTLYLNDLPITDAGLDAIQDLPALHDLDLSRTRVQGSFLTELKSLPRLTTLNLADSDLNEGQLQALAGATNLQSLSLRGVPLTPNALPLLQAIPQLRDLDITGCGLLDKEVNALRASNPKLKIIPR